MLVCLLASCDGGGHHLLIELYTDLIRGEEITQAIVTIDGQSHSVELTARPDPLGPSRVFSGVYPPGDYASELALRGPSGEDVIEPRRFIVELDSARIVQVYASRRCQGVECGADTACFDGLCRSPACVAGDEDGCLSGDECEDGCPAASECAIVACTPENQCLFGADDSACPEGGRCDPFEGCVQSVTCEDTCFGDMCHTARCDGDRCVLEPSLSCDDGDPCTDDRCDPETGCVTEPAMNGTSCSDGMFCNGAEVCTDGVCGASPPCPADCDPVAGRCVGCVLDIDCGSPYNDPPPPCSFADTCDESAPRIIMRHTPRCEADECTEDVAMVPGPACTRDTDGVSCGVTMDSAWTCVPPPSNACAASGTREVTRTTFVCEAGACASNSFPFTISGSCSTGIMDGDVCAGDDSWICCGETCVNTRFSEANCGGCALACNTASSYECDQLNPAGGGGYGNCECGTTADCPSGFTCDHSRCVCPEGASGDALCGPGRRCGQRTTHAWFYACVP